MQVDMRGSSAEGNENRDNKDNENNKKTVYNFGKYVLLERLRTTPQLVTDNDKRQHRRMMNTIRNRGRWAAASKNIEAEKQIWSTWARAKRWMHLTRNFARMAREYEGKTRKHSPREAMIYGAHDLEGPL